MVSLKGKHHVAALDALYAQCAECLVTHFALQFGTAQQARLSKLYSLVPHTLLCRIASRRVQE